MLGQYEEYDPTIWESSVYSDYPYDQPIWGYDYQAQQEAIQATVESGGGFFDIFKSILSLATPVVASIMKAEQKPVTPTPQAYLTSIGVPVKTGAVQATSLLGTLTSSPLLLIGLGLGGFLLIRGRGKGKRRGK